MKPKTFKQFLREMAFESPKMSGDDYEGFTSQLWKLVDEAISNMKLISSHKIIWRGQKLPHGLYGIVYKVTNNRQGFMGKILSKVESLMFALKEIKLLNSQPIFTTRSFSNAKFFGTPYIVLPIRNFTTLYNEDVVDSAHYEGVVEKAVQGYKKYENTFPPENWNGEIVLDTDYYYLINIDKVVRELKLPYPEKYSDAISLLNKYLQMKRK